MTVQTGDVIRVAAIMDFNSVDDVINTFQLRLSAGGPQPEAVVGQDVADYLEFIYGPLQGHISNQVGFRRIRSVNITQDLAVDDTTWPTLVAGTAAGEALPPGVAAVSNFTTKYPKITLRKFWGVMTEAANDPSGRLSSALIAAIGTTMAVLINPGNFSGRIYEFGYLSPVAGEFVIPLGGLVTSIWGYNRRRKQGKGS